MSEQPKTPPPEGLRGESATPFADPSAEQTHTVRSSGRTVAVAVAVAVAKTSGTRFVEATGEARFAEDGKAPSASTD